MAAIRKRHHAGFKAKVALAAMMEQATIAQLARKYAVHPNQITKWKRLLLDGAVRVFEDGPAPEADHDREELLRKIGELTLERDFLERGLRR